MAETKYGQSLLKKVTVSIVAVAFVVFMAADISRVMTIGRADSDIGYFVVRAVLYFMAAIMLLQAAFRDRSKKILYGTLIVMGLIIVCDLLIERGLNSDLLIPFLGYFAIEITGEKRNNSYVRVASVFLMLAFIPLVIIGIWEISDYAEFRKDEAAFKKHPVRFKLVTREAEHDAYKKAEKKKWYYEINTKKEALPIIPFDYEKPEIISSCDIYKSYVVDEDEDRELKNEVQWNSMGFEDEKGKKVELTNIEKDIVKAGAKIDHDIIQTRIYKIKDDYYAEFELNVNLWTPYCFYEYDKERKKLKEIYTFNDETVVGIKRVR